MTRSLLRATRRALIVVLLCSPIGADLAFHAFARAAADNADTHAAARSQQVLVADIRIPSGIPARPTLSPR